MRGPCDLPAQFGCLTQKHFTRRYLYARTRAERTILSAPMQKNSVASPLRRLKHARIPAGACAAVKCAGCEQSSPKSLISSSETKRRTEKIARGTPRRASASDGPNADVPVTCSSGPRPGAAPRIRLRPPESRGRARAGGDARRKGGSATARLPRRRTACETNAFCTSRPAGSRPTTRPGRRGCLKPAVLACPPRPVRLADEATQEPPERPAGTLLGASLSFDGALDEV